MKSYFINPISSIHQALANSRSAPKMAHTIRKTTSRKIVKTENRKTNHNRALPLKWNPTEIKSICELYKVCGKTGKEWGHRKRERERERTFHILSVFFDVFK